MNRSAISREDWNSFFNVALAKSPNQRFRSAREMLEALNSILPASDQTYFPFGFDGSLNDSTGRFEKTYIAEAEPAAPTLMINTSQILEDSSHPPVEAAQATTMVEEPRPFLNGEAVELETVVQTDLQPVDINEVPLEEMQPELEMALDAALQESGSEENTLKPVPVEEMQSPLEMDSPLELEFPKTELVQAPTHYSVTPPVSEPDFPATMRPQPQSSLPADFVPASGNFLEFESPESDEMATIPPSESRDVAAQASDTSPIVSQSEPEPEPELELIEPPGSAPTQLLKTPTLDQSSGNGRDPAAIDSIPATVIGTFHTPVPEPPSAATAFVTSSDPPEIPKDHLSAPTAMMQDVHPLVSAAEMKPATEPSRPPVVPAQAPSVPVHPLSKPMESTPAPPASKPPAMQRYFYAAIAVFIFISIVGAGILFFRKPPGDVQAPAPPPPKTVTDNTGNTPPPVQPSPVNVAELGSIMITSEPAGATVFVAGEERGITPVEVPQLPLGKHMLKLQLKGYQDLEQEVELTAENPNASLPSFTMAKAAAVNGTLVIDSDPPGAFIVIANRVLGVTPKTVYRKPGNYNILLKKDGYQDYSGTAVVALEKRVTFKGVLAEIPKPVPVVEAPKPKPPEVTRGQLVTLGPDVIAPKPINKVYAKYPEAAKVRKLQGTVRLNVLIDETGRVLDIKVVKSAHPMLDDAVVKAYQQWTFQPATKQGVPVKVWITVAMSFQSGR